MLDASIIVAIITSATTIIGAIIVAYQAIIIAKINKGEAPPKTGAEEVSSGTKTRSAAPGAEAGISQISEEAKTIDFYSKPRDYASMLEQAEHTIFFSGITLNNIDDLRASLPKIEPHVEVNLALVNVDNSDIRAILSHLFGLSDEDIDFRSASFLDAFKKLNRKGKSDINIYVMDTYDAVGYVGIDYRVGTAHSKIEAKYNVLHEDENKTFYLNVRPDAKIYAEFQKHIFYIERNEKKYSIGDYIQNIERLKGS